MNQLARQQAHRSRAERLISSGLDFHATLRTTRRAFRAGGADAARCACLAQTSAPQQEVITYCQAGIRAAHVFFVLSLLGYNRVRNYDGSMREWANRDETPLVLPA